MLANYVIVPGWLTDLLTSHTLPLNLVLDYQRIKSLLSAEEFYFYIYINTPMWEEKIVGTKSHRVVQRIRSMIPNYIMENFNCDENLVTYHNVAELKNANDIGSKKLENLWLEPVIVEKDIFGLITRNDPNLSVRMRRDIYHTLNKLMPAADIIRSPIFGV